MDESPCDILLAFCTEPIRSIRSTSERRGHRDVDCPAAPDVRATLAPLAPGLQLPKPTLVRSARMGMESADGIRRFFFADVLI